MKTSTIIITLAATSVAITWSQALATAAETLAAPATGQASVTSEAQKTLQQTDLRESTTNNALGLAFDYFRPSVQTHFNGPPGYPGTVEENLSGDLYGSTVYYQYKRFRLEGTGRTGTLRGSGDTLHFAWGEKVERTEAEVLAGFMLGKCFYLGAGYEYISQDYTMTAPWIVPSGSAKFNDYFHNFFAQGGIHYPITVMKGEGALSEIRLIPRLLGAFGYGYYSSQSTSFVNPQQNQFTYRAQATLIADFTFRHGWDLFVEGGYRYNGLSETKRTQGGDYYGPYARAGVRYSF